MQESKDSNLTIQVSKLAMEAEPFLVGFEKKESAAKGE
jgi:hypothetical protein